MRVVDSSNFLESIKEDGIYEVVAPFGSSGFHSELLVKEGDKIHHFNINEKGVRELTLDQLKGKITNWTRWSFFGKATHLTKLTLSS